MTTPPLTYGPGAALLRADAAGNPRPADADTWRDAYAGRTPVRVLPDALDDATDLDHVIRVQDDGLVLLSVPDVYAPELYLALTADGADPLPGAWEALAASVTDQGWATVGRSGQQGGGPWMHTSEYVGGGLADEILQTPGTYVAVEIRGLRDCEPDGDESALEDEPIGWAMLCQVETTPCDECNADIPDAAPSMFDAAHLSRCSLHPGAVAGDADGRAL